jgi:hypothetical protein
MLSIIILIPSLLASANAASQPPLESVCRLSFPDRQCLRIVPLQSDRFNHLAWLELCGQRPSEFILVGPKCQPLAGAHPTLLGPDSDLAYSSFFAGLGKLMDGLPADDGDLIEFLVESLGLYYRGQRLILLRIHTNKEDKKENNCE